MSDDFKRPRRVKSHDCPMSACAAPVGSPCRTGKGNVAIQYHTARFRLGYARASTARQSLDAQLDSLAEAEVTRVFSEKISTCATKRPEMAAAVKLAGEIRSSGAAVTLVVHEHKRLGRGIELAMLAEELKVSEAGPEFLTGELKGSHDPASIVFTVLAAMSGMEREYIRDRTPPSCGCCTNTTSRPLRQRGVLQEPRLGSSVHGRKPHPQAPFVRRPVLCPWIRCTSAP
ncbi:recombinase family protein [Streptomyces sp. NPDC093510]|uniref:recombinase family protein n=1 Tax=Streptomyces sp. NPDC093510 TaxID=3155199 RepID=UPI0034425D26